MVFFFNFENYFTYFNILKTDIEWGPDRIHIRVVNLRIHCKDRRPDDEQVIASFLN